MSSAFVCIAAYDTAHQAHLIRSQVESAGIPVFLRNEYLVSTNSIYGIAAGGVEVMVPEECVHDALRFLQGEPVEPVPVDKKNGKTGSGAPGGDAEERTDVCPHCGGRMERRRRLWPSLLALLFCGASPGESSVWRCASCGKKAR